MSIMQGEAIRIAAALLPPGAELAYLEHPVRHPAVLAADLDGDGYPEVVGVFKLQGNMRALIGKMWNGAWHVVSHIQGPGYEVANLMAAPIVMRGANTLLIGWQIGDIWGQLDLWQFDQGTYRHLTPRDIFFSKLGVEDMPGQHGVDGICEIALWVHDAEEAYKIGIWRWQRGGLVSDSDSYPYYFRKVVIPYYERLARSRPESPIYRQHLSDAIEKAGVSGETESP